MLTVEVVRAAYFQEAIRANDQKPLELEAVQDLIKRFDLRCSLPCGSTNNFAVSSINTMRSSPSWRKNGVQEDLQAQGRIFYGWRLMWTRRSSRLAFVRPPVRIMREYLLINTDLPDLTDAENCIYLDRWEGAWSYLSTLKWVRISSKGVVQQAKFPPKGE